MALGQFSAEKAPVLVVQHASRTPCELGASIIERLFHASNGTTSSEIHGPWMNISDNDHNSNVLITGFKAHSGCNRLQTSGFAEEAARRAPGGLRGLFASSLDPWTFRSISFRKQL